MMLDLDLELSDLYETIRACVRHDTRRMTSANAVKYCDNVFKVHCSGLDLLTEIGEAQVRKCEELLGTSLGLRLDQYKGWKTCGQHRVFDRYSLEGESSDEDACRAVFLDECGTNIDSVVRTDEASQEQQVFAQCCSADALGKIADGDSDRECGMIDDGFPRGPCHEHPICVNRLTSEWISCSVPE